TLDRALAEGDGLLWNVEIKTPAALGATLDVAGDWRATRRLLVTSFWHPLVVPFADLGLETGLLLASRPLGRGALAALLPPGGRVRTLVWDYEILDGELCEMAAGWGVRSLVYGAKTAGEHRRCLGLEAAGLAGIITDHLEFLPSPGRAGGR
nr:hypothetical protein [Acidobacteriota bacterium]